MSRIAQSSILLLPSLMVVALLPMLGTPGCCPDGSFPPCTVTNGPTTLVNESFAFVPPPRNFNPSAAGKTIIVTVSGNATGSRIAVVVTDFLTTNVVAQQILPTTNTTTVQFTSTSNGVHVVTSNDIGAVASATYTMLVTEQ